MRDRLALVFISMGKWISVSAFFLFVLSFMIIEDIGLFSNITLMIEDHFLHNDDFILLPIVMITILILTIIGDLFVLVGSILSKKYKGIKKVFIVASIPASFLIPFIFILGLGYLSYPLSIILLNIFYPLYLLSIAIAITYSIFIWNILIDIPVNVKSVKKRNYLKFLTFFILYTIVLFLPFFLGDDPDIGEVLNDSSVISFILSIFILGFLFEKLLGYGPHYMSDDEDFGKLALFLKLPKIGFINIIVGTIILLIFILISLQYYEFDILAIIFIPYIPSIWIGFLLITISIPVYRKIGLMYRNINDGIHRLNNRIHNGISKINNIIDEKNFVNHNVRTISVFLALITAGSIGMSLRYSILTMDRFYTFDLNRAIIIGVIFIFIMLYPRGILRLFIKENRKKSHYIYLAFITSLFIYMVLMSLGIIGPYTRESYYEDTYIYFRNVRYIWMITAIIPNFSLLIILSMLKLSKIRKIQFGLFMAITTALIIVWNLVLIDSLEDMDGGFITEYSSVLFTIIPALYSIFIPWMFYRKDKKSIVSDVKRWFLRIVDIIKVTILSIGPVLSVLFVLMMVIGMSDSYDSWHSYRYEEEFPETGEDYIEEYLSKDIPGIFNTSLYEGESLLDPNFITMETIDRLKKWVNENEDEKDWGSYYGNVYVELKNNITVSVNRTKFEKRYGDPKAEILIDGESNIIYEEERSTFVYIENGKKVSIKNETGFWGEWKNKNLTKEFSNISLIKSEMDFGQQTAPLAGYGGSLTQYLGIDDDRIVFIFCQRNNWVS